jgi:Ca2+-binding RTX toxin-like protein
MLEHLEQRRLLSAVIEDGILNIGGTNGDDQISLRVSDDLAGQVIDVNINGELSQFRLTEVKHVVINANAGDDRVVLGQDPDSALTWVIHYDVPTLVLGGRGQDTILGGDGNDTLDGGTGVNEVDGRGGDDVLRAWNTDTDDLRGGAGIDTVDYSGRTQNLAISLDDVADDGAKPPEMWITDLGGFVFVPEHDNVHADIENVIGGLGGDEIAGNQSDNVFSGGGGSDVLFGGFGRDTLIGDAGNDRLIGGGAGDVLFGGAGNDVADYSDHKAGPGVHVTLDGLANDGAYEFLARVLYSGLPPTTSLEYDNVNADVENVVGTSGDDYLFGNDDSNTLDGGGGNDFLDGGGGRDLLRGGDGNDRFLAADDSPDTIRGGDGDDTADGDADDLLVGADRGTVIAF